MNRHHRYVGLVLAVLVFLLTGQAHAGRDEALRSYHLGLRFLDQGNFSEAIETLRRAVHEDFKFADAHAKLAEAYAALDTIEGRRLAVEEYRLALRYDSDNADYQLALGRVYVNQTFDRYAEACFRKAIEIDPELTEAYLERGLIYIRRWLTFRQYDDDLERAHDCFQEASDRGSTDRDILFHLARLSIEREDPETALDIATRTLEMNPDDTEMRFVMALALHDLERLEEAETQYARAISAMDVQDKLVFLGIEEVASQPLQRFLRKIDPDSTAELARRFWREHDPYLATQVNERLLEHYRRILKADLYFTSEKTGLKGRYSDRGRSYVRYGPPTEMTCYIAENLRPNEMWSYHIGGHRFRFRFEDRFLNGEFGFPFDFEPEKDGGSAKRWQILVRQLPEFYVPEYEGKEIRLIADACSFSRIRGETHQEIYYTVPGRELHFRKDPEGWSSKLERRIVIYDRDWHVVAAESTTVITEPAGSLELLRDAQIVDQCHFDLKPGTYLAAVQVEDAAAEVLGVTEVGIVARTFEGRELEISDIELARSIKPATGKSRFNKVSLRVEPEPSHRFRRSKPVNLYYEVYGLALDESAQSHFKSTVRVIPLDVEEEESFWDAARRLFGRKPSTPPHIASTFTHRYPSGSAPLHLSLDLTTLKPGVYRVTVGVHDLVADTRTARSTSLYITR